MAIAAQAALARLVAGEDLDRQQTESLFGQLMDGEMPDAVKAGLLVALAIKGESVDEIAGAAAAMRRRVVEIPHGLPTVVDTCGTGGDGRGTFNISTAAALVAAATGVPIAKHGNRSVSSRSGSADVLAELGLALDLEPDQVAGSIREVGIGFLFAPRLHPAMAAVVDVRRQLGMRTIFNVLGPLTNPAGAQRQLLGVYSDDLVETAAAVLAELGSEHALVVHGSDGLDELTLAGPTKVAEVRAGRPIDVYEVGPEQFGLARRPTAELAGGEPAENATRLRAVLAGQPGPLRDVTLLNAAAVIYLGERAPTIAEGLDEAARAIDSGDAAELLDRLVSFAKGAA